MKNKASIAAFVASFLAAPAVQAQPAASNAALTQAAASQAKATQGALDKLNGCLKLAAGSARNACVADVQKAAGAIKKVSVPAPAQAKTKSATGAPPPPVPPEVKQAAGEMRLNGMTQKGTSVGGIGGNIQVRDISGLDLETAMMMVQSRRAELLEDSLKSQLAAVGDRNKEIAELHDLAAALKARRPGGTDKEMWSNLGANQAQGRVVMDRIKAAGLTLPAGADAVNETGTGIFDAKQKTYDAWDAQIKAKMDAMNSSQQMDMLRLQSLTNKRNEAFDLMTNFIKKMADSRSSILGNMR